MAKFRVKNYSKIYKKHLSRSPEHYNRLINKAENMNSKGKTCTVFRKCNSKGEAKDFLFCLLRKAEKFPIDEYEDGNEVVTITRMKNVGTLPNHPSKLHYYKIVSRKNGSFLDLTTIHPIADYYGRSHHCANENAGWSSPKEDLLWRAHQRQTVTQRRRYEECLKPTLTLHNINVDN